MRIATAALSMIATSAALCLAQAPERTGEQIVKQQCASCHEKGLHGAPRIDDRAAWAPRIKNGLDATVRSAINGHGKMPARGGLVSVTDNELRSAIAYMFNPAGVPPKPAPAISPGPNQKVVDGTQILLGVMAKGQDQHQVTITLRDAATHKPISGAQVEAKVTNPVMGAETKKLAELKAGDVPTYPADFRLSGKEPHVITVQVRRPQNPRTVEAAFEYKGATQ